VGKGFFFFQSPGLKRFKSRSDVLSGVSIDSFLARISPRGRMHCDERGYEIMAGMIDDWIAWNDWFR
jgi:hypothetical protein